MSASVSRWLFALALVAVSIAAGWALVTYRPARPPDAQAAGNTTSAHPAARQARLSPQAQRNLDLVSKPLQIATYWRRIELPGTIVDRPGVSDRRVAAPVTATVGEIHAYPGDTVEPRAPLVSLRLVSDALHASQLELYKATRQIELNEGQRQRLADAARSGALPESRLVELDNQLRLLEVTAQAYRQDLRSRGLAAAEIQSAANGDFLTQLLVRAPEARPARRAMAASAPAAPGGPLAPPPQPAPPQFEVHDLKVDLGQQVQAGQVLCTLADHRALLVEGRGFKDDMTWIQAAARRGWEVEIEYDAAPAGAWDAAPAKLPIHHVANTVDAESRTFAFYLELDNSWQSYTRDGQTRLLWRFHPGDRVRLRVAVDRLDGVFVVPQDAVARDGPEAYVFRQNGDLFLRLPVHVLHQDRTHAVLANDGSVRPGWHLAQNAAATLNRVLKAQAASGSPAAPHVHADGSVHAH